MKPTKKTSMCVLISTIIFLTGCQSGFMKKPDLGKLAFWKKNELKLASRSDEISPPSAHFSPDPGNQIKSNAKNELKASIDEIIAEANRNKKADADPIRQPYSLDSIDPKINESNVSSASDSKPNSKDFVLSEKLDKTQSVTNQALGMTENSVKQTGAIVEESANQFAGWKNTLQNSGDNQAKNFTGQLKEQASQAIESTTENVSSVAKNTVDSINQTVSTVTNSLDNSFQATKASQVVTNPYSKAETDDAKSQTPTNNTVNEFVSKYKNPTKTDSGILSSGGESSLTRNSISSQKTKQLASEVTQSSFDANIEKNAATILQPVNMQQSQDAQTQYPSTNYDAIRPIKSGTGVKPSGVSKIPPSLLRGTSSFAPGSTKPLRPANSGN